MKVEADLIGLELIGFNSGFCHQASSNLRANMAKAGGEQRQTGNYYRLTPLPTRTRNWIDIENHLAIALKMVSTNQKNKAAMQKFSNLLCTNVKYKLKRQISASG